MTTPTIGYLNRPNEYDKCSCGNYKTDRSRNCMACSIAAMEIQPLKRLIEQPDHDDFRLIPLTQGQVAKVSVEDYDFLSQFNWFANRDRKGNFYALRSGKRKRGFRRVWPMHGCVSGAIPPYVTDHINHDTLDNRRENLRIVTKDENAKNRLPSAPKRRENKKSGQSQ